MKRCFSGSAVHGVDDAAIDQHEVAGIERYVDVGETPEDAVEAS